MSSILSFFGHAHDSAISLIEDGNVLLNLEKERYSRIRHDKGIGVDFFNYFFEKINRNKIDIIATEPKTIPILLEDGIISNVSGIPPLSNFEELKRNLIYFGECTFHGKKTPLVSVHHHYAHAASAFYTSPFDTASVITADSGGLGYNFSLNIAKDGYLSPLDYKWTSPLGFWWIRLPHYYGITEPGTLMAISAYGKENSNLKNELLSKIIHFYNEHYKNLVFEMGLGWNEKLMPKKILDPKKKGAADLAFALQSITDDIFTGWFLQASKLSNSKNLCFAGGLALNCIGNTRAFLNADLEKIHIPPNPHDGGLAMGIGLAAYYTKLNIKYQPKVFFSPYNGPKYSDAEINSILEKIVAKHDNLKYYPVNNEEISELLAKGKIIARFFDSSESGPRALGHRSFIARPDLPNLRKIMNEVKQREWYRPFAPIVISKEAKKLFEKSVFNSYYMNTSAIIKKEWQSRLRGVMHVDGSTRPQFVDEYSCKDTYDLLKRFFKKTRIPAILNTSFNIKEPLVESPEDAIKTFLKINKNVSHLQINNFIIEKI